MALDIHIGRMVRDELKRQGRSVAWLAKQLPTNRTNAYDMLKRSNIDPETLMRISELLQCNFFVKLAEEAEGRLSGNMGHNVGK